MVVKMDASLSQDKLTARALANYAGASSSLISGVSPGRSWRFRCTGGRSLSACFKMRGLQNERLESAVAAIGVELSDHWSGNKRPAIRIRPAKALDTSPSKFTLSL